jgi:hypothetical protein
MREEWRIPPCPVKNNRLRSTVRCSQIEMGKTCWTPDILLDGDQEYRDKGSRRRRDIRWLTINGTGSVPFGYLTTSQTDKKAGQVEKQSSLKIRPHFRLWAIEKGRSAGRNSVTVRRGLARCSVGLPENVWIWAILVRIRDTSACFVRTFLDWFIN